MNVYVLPVVFSSDTQTNKSYLLTQENDEYLLPLFKVQYVEFFHQELLQQIKNLFVADTIKVNNECSYSFIDIQNALSVKYVAEHHENINKNDMIITYGGILLKYKCLPNYRWTEFKIHTQHQGFSPDKNLNLLLDYIIKRSVI